MQVISEFKRGGTFSATVKIPDIEPDGKAANEITSLVNEILKSGDTNDE